MSDQNKITSFIKDTADVGKEIYIGTDAVDKVNIHGKSDVNISTAGGADSIQVGDAIVFGRRGSEFISPQGTVKIALDAGSGDDFVRVGTYTNTMTGTVKLGSGNDVFEYWDAVNGADKNRQTATHLVVNGGAGRDTLEINPKDFTFKRLPNGSIELRNVNYTGGLLLHGVETIKYNFAEGKDLVVEVGNLPPQGNNLYNAMKKYGITD